MILCFFAGIATVPAPQLRDIHLLKTPPIGSIYDKLRFFLCVL
ncbi:hypothetical protein A464_3040 [Salmonella bongori N268-08]|uniref:Uncharacterized protein n=1 Tax=Salmonella bongori N268-08 TaxID=1197719 RepID=S5N035_SALBN|nr:hypothetical protein A464_3040 [Salmonella bongori N268-08]